MKNYFNATTKEITAKKIAIETAKIMMEESIDEPYIAIKKAVKRLKIQTKHHLPTNEDISEQLKIYQLLHSSKYADPDILTSQGKKFYASVLSIMQPLESFNPKLITSLTLKYKQQQNPIKLLVYADTAEEVAVFLMTINIPYKIEQWKLFIKNRHPIDLPCYSFLSDQHTIKLMLLTEKYRKTTPMEPHSWTPIKKLSIAQINSLI